MRTKKVILKWIISSIFLFFMIYSVMLLRGDHIRVEDIGIDAKVNVSHTPITTGQVFTMNKYVFITQMQKKQFFIIIS